MGDCSKLLFNRKEAAQLLSLSVRSLDYALANGELRAKRFGRKVLIPRTALIRFAGQDHQNTKSSDEQ